MVCWPIVKLGKYALSACFPRFTFGQQTTSEQIDLSKSTWPLLDAQQVDAMCIEGPWSKLPLNCRFSADG